MEMENEYPGQVEKQTLKDLENTQTASGHKNTKRKFILYSFGAIILLGAIFFIIREVNALLKQGNYTSIALPKKVEKVDTTGTHPPALTNVYEKEAKNKRREQFRQDTKEKELELVQMRWQNIYEIKEEDLKKEEPVADTLQLLLAALKESNKEKKENQVAEVKKTEVQRQEKKHLAKKASKLSSGQAKDLESNSREQKYSKPYDAFNTTHASSEVVSSSFSQTLELLIPAVIHGEHKVKAGRKVTFRLLEDAFINGTNLPKNSLLIAVAKFGSGRISFDGFKAKVDGRSIDLSLKCYDQDLMAGISYDGEGAIESSVRQSGNNALSDAANDLSSAIPYGSLARASANLTRGVLRGSSRSRDMFIYLNDGFKVFLETAKK
jgi:hypothetical protein